MDTESIRPQIRNAEIHRVESEIGSHFDAIADLRSNGARLLADAKASGGEVIQWLTERGASDKDARVLCVEIILERRKQRESADPS